MAGRLAGRFSADGTWGCLLFMGWYLSYSTTYTEGRYGWSKESTGQGAGTRKHLSVG